LIVQRTTQRSKGAPSAEPPAELAFRLYRFSTDQVMKMAEVGVFGEDRLELLDGWLVSKMTTNPPHGFAVRQLTQLIPPLLPPGWVWQTEQALVLKGSEPEPDFAIITGPMSRYRTAHPGPRETSVVIEVADSSLSLDRGLMRTIYAADRIPVYWIVNLVDRRVEVFTSPRAGKSPTYRSEEHFGPDEAVPVVIAGVTVGTIAVADLLA